MRSVNVGGPGDGVAGRRRSKRPPRVMRGILAGRCPNAMKRGLLGGNLRVVTKELTKEAPINHVACWLGFESFASGLRSALRGWLAAREWRCAARRGWAAWVGAACECV